jgi:putative tricarboxylic transport membrane protein
LANRLSGLAVSLFGLALLLWLIPAHTETVDYGWMRPDTLPRACAWGLLTLGLVQAAVPRGGVALDRGEVLWVAALVVVSGVAIWAMGRVGFLVVAPLFAALLVALIRERRWPWILAAVAGAPALTWLVVSVLLNRPLP